MFDYLQALKDGVFDVLPDNSMNSLTAEDLRLLLNGVGDINVSTLISYTTFNDESSEGPDKLLKFKKWFWSIVEKMNILERQDLVRSYCKRHETATITAILSGVLLDRIARAASFGGGIPTVAICHHKTRG